MNWLLYSQRLKAQHILSTSSTTVVCIDQRKKYFDRKNQCADRLRKVASPAKHRFHDDDRDKPAIARQIYGWP
jgi:hypothetical protein